MNSTMKKKYKNHHSSLFLFGFISLIGIGAFFLITQHIMLPPSMESLAKEIRETCKGAKNAEICYEKEIPKVMDTPLYLSLEQTFQITKLVQNLDKTYNSCHVLGHKISAKETQKNPTAWKDVLSRCPQGMCSNGCIHGAFQERFRAESFSDKMIEKYKPELLQVCTDKTITSGLVRGSCIHAIGHLAMYITNADIKKSLSLCTEITKSQHNESYKQICFDGAFMQIFQPIEREDISLVRNISVKKETALTFCDQFPSDEKVSCWRESWPLTVKDILQDKGVERFCNKLDGPNQSSCYTSLFYIIPLQFQFNTEKMRNYCLNLSENLQKECLGIGAVRFIQNDYENGPLAIQFCKDIKNPMLQEGCFSTLADFASFIYPKKENLLNNFCTSMPSSYQTACKKD